VILLFGILSDYRTKLTALATYTLVWTDVRMASFESLNSKQQDQIKELFDSIDTDKSGFLKHQEIRAYFNKKQKEELESLQKETALQLKSVAPGAKNGVIKFAEISEGKLKKRNEQELADLISRDIDGDNQISFEEFALHEAGILLASERGDELSEK